MLAPFIMKILSNIFHNYSFIAKAISLLTSTLSRITMRFHFLFFPVRIVVALLSFIDSSTLQPPSHTQFFIPERSCSIHTLALIITLLVMSTASNDDVVDIVIKFRERIRRKQQINSRVDETGKRTCKTNLILL